MIKKKISKKEGYKKAKDIIDILEDKDKEALERTNYVCYDDIIEFPQPCAFTIKRLKKLIREAEKYQKEDGKGMLIGMEIKIDMKKHPELKKIAKKNKNRRLISVKTKEIK